MPMMKDYTFIYFINAYPRDPFSSPEADLKRGEEVNMDPESSELLFSPSEQSVQKILNFSKSYEVLNAKLTSNIEVIKN